MTLRVLTCTCCKLSAAYALQAAGQAEEGEVNQEFKGGKKRGGGEEGGRKEGGSGLALSTLLRQSQNIPATRPGAY